MPGTSTATAHRRWLRRLRMLADGVYLLGGTTHNSYMVEFSEVQRMKLEVATLAPVHGQPVPWSAFVSAMGEGTR